MQIPFNVRTSSAKIGPHVGQSRPMLTKPSPNGTQPSQTWPILANFGHTGETRANICQSLADAGRLRVGIDPGSMLRRSGFDSGASWGRFGSKRNGFGALGRFRSIWAEVGGRFGAGPGVVSAASRDALRTPEIMLPGGDGDPSASRQQRCLQPWPVQL